ncbi:hypothetical protein IKP85_04490 [bacterium]|nr:hypothetical protein [bacterium]
MKVDSIKEHNVTPSFGHSFRVNICLKNETGCGDIFVSPSSNKKLYRTLNAQLVSWLNQDFYANLRSVFGITRKIDAAEPVGKLHRDMIRQLLHLDSDYSMFQHVRSVYNGGRLGYIVTGGDVSIVENIKGMKNIGLAKADPFWSDQTAKNDYIRNLSLAINNSVKEFVKHDNVLLRSKDNKEIMLRAVFKKTGTNSNGNPTYELDRFEFHENKTHAPLKHVNPNYANYKRSRAMLEEIKETIRHHVNKLLGKKSHFKDEDLAQFIKN